MVLDREYPIERTQKGFTEFAWKYEWVTYHFEPRAQHAKLAKSHMEGRASEAAIRLLHHHHVNGPRQRRAVDLVVEVAEVRDELADIVHRIHG